MVNILKLSALTRRAGFTPPLEKTTDLKSDSFPLKTEGGIKPLSGQTFRKRSSLTGFTLVELMIATAILVVVIVGLLSVFIHSIFLNESNGNLVTAINDAQYVLEQIKSLPYGNITNFTADFDSDQFSNLENETVTFPDDDVGATIANITVSVNWTERQRSRSVQLSTHITRTANATE